MEERAQIQATGNFFSVHYNMVHVAKSRVAHELFTILRILQESTEDILMNERHFLECIHNQVNRNYQSPSTQVVDLALELI